MISRFDVDVWFPVLSIRLGIVSGLKWGRGGWGSNCCIFISLWTLTGLRLDLIPKHTSLHTPNPGLFGEVMPIFQKFRTKIDKAVEEPLQRIEESIENHQRVDADQHGYLLFTCVGPGLINGHKPTPTCAYDITRHKQEGLRTDKSQASYLILLCLTALWFLLLAPHDYRIR